MIQCKEGRVVDIIPRRQPEVTAAITKYKIISLHAYYYFGLLARYNILSIVNSEKLKTALSPSLSAQFHTVTHCPYWCSTDGLNNHIYEWRPWIIMLDLPASVFPCRTTPWISYEARRSTFHQGLASFVVSTQNCPRWRLSRFPSFPCSAAPPAVALEAFTGRNDPIFTTENTKDC